MPGPRRRKGRPPDVPKGREYRYDGRIMGTTMSGRPLPAEWAGINTPTLVLDGGKSEQFMHDGADALATLLPNARRHTIADQDHAVDPAVLAPVLAEFFGR